ncbi:MAG TPA: NIPSNAP family protein [Streptosporangiales bacterium]
MIYELREYVAADGMADRLHARFADHTFGLFAEHGLELAGFWTDAADQARIVYLLRFPDETARREAWAGFQNDPKWKQVKAESEADGPIVAEMTSRILTTPPYADGGVA